MDGSGIRIDQQIKSTHDQVACFSFRVSSSKKIINKSLLMLVKLFGGSLCQQTKFISLIGSNAS
jgi:hypothetical protein